MYKYIIQSFLQKSNINLQICEHFVYFQLNNVKYNRTYISSNDESGIESLRTLVYDFLSAQDAIIASRQCNDITDWVRSVVERLNPSLKGYSNQQIDLAMALILYEQSERDVTYRDLFCRFTEIYKENGGVY